MKRPQGYIVAPFSFTDEQRRILLKCWPRKKDHDAANLYLNKVNEIAEIWLSVRNNEPRTSAKDTKRAANNIFKATSKLLHCLNELSEMSGESLKAKIDCQLYLPQYQRVHYKVSNEFQALKGGMAGGHEFVETLENWLKVLNAASKELANLTPRSGMDKSNERWLIDMLASAYQHSFDEQPSASNGSKFLKFTAALSNVLYCTLGTPIVREVIKHRHNSSLNNR
jgi:hypothetical protein